MLPGEGQGLREPTPAMRGAAPTRDGGRGRTTEGHPSAPAGPQEEAPGVGWKVCRDPRPGAGRQGGLRAFMGKMPGTSAAPTTFLPLPQHDPEPVPHQQ